MRAKNTNIITNYRYFLNVFFEKCREFIDKANVIVTMCKETYLNKSQALLNDTKYFKKLDNNSNSTVQQKAKKLL